MDISFYKRYIRGYNGYILYIHMALAWIIQDIANYWKKMYEKISRYSTLGVDISKKSFIYPRIYPWRGYIHGYIRRGYIQTYYIHGYIQKIYRFWIYPIYLYPWIYPIYPLISKNDKSFFGYIQKLISIFGYSENGCKWIYPEWMHPKNIYPVWIYPKKIYPLSKKIYPIWTHVHEVLTVWNLCTLHIGKYLNWGIWTVMSTWLSMTWRSTTKFSMTWLYNTTAHDITVDNMTDPSTSWCTKGTTSELGCHYSYTSCVQSWRRHSFWDSHVVENLVVDSQVHMSVHIPVQLMYIIALL